jgi:hypothetical protein
MIAHATAGAGPLRADPGKRVNYTLGMVLGVDDFQQDQLYHAAGRRWHNRLLHGYGTVWGLSLSASPPEVPDREIRIGAGVAVDPCGREVCVPDPMCVHLDRWLARHRPTLEQLYPAGVPALPLAVVLCHRECPDDVVPVPGEACRTQEDAMQPSRTRDSFELRLALREDAAWGSPPGENETGLHTFTVSHHEEDAVRALGELLAEVRTTDAAPPGGREALLDAVRGIAPDGADGGSPVSSPPGEILLREAEAADAVRDAFRVWTTEVRPRLRALESGASPCGAGDGECCVLLADVELPVTAAWQVAGAEIEIDQARRPVLLHTRLLQEWLAARDREPTPDASTLVSLEALAPRTVRAWIHHEAPLAVPPEAVRVSVDGADFFQPTVSTVSGTRNGFNLGFPASMRDGASVEVRLDLARVEVDGTSHALADLVGAGLDRQGSELRAYTIYDRLDRFFGGDLTGRHPGPRVARLQGTEVAAENPEDADFLGFDGSRWVARPAVQAPGGAYAVVGAGRFRGDGQRIGPTHNGLRVGVTRVDSGGARTWRFALEFDGYVVPAAASGHTYVVQATWQEPGTGEARPFRFAGFEPGHVLLTVTVPAPDPNPVEELMVEISRIGTPSGGS